jgi:hypothetical protein
MVRWLAGITCLCFAVNANAQNYQVLKDRMADVRLISESGSKEKLETWWATLSAANQIPIIAEDSVYFMFKGQAKSVEWIGDFNGWGYQKDFQNKGTQLNNTDIWILKTSFPKDARLTGLLTRKINFNNGRVLVVEVPIQSFACPPGKRIRFNWKERMVVREH